MTTNFWALRGDFLFKVAAKGVAGSRLASAVKMRSKEVAKGMKHANSATSTPWRFRKDVYPSNGDNDRSGAVREDCSKEESLWRRPEPIAASPVRPSGAVSVSACINVKFRGLESGSTPNGSSNLTALVD